jgi:hypothetical protein
MQKVLLITAAPVAIAAPALACGPLPFCDEGKHLQDACKKPLELDSYLNIKVLQLMARAFIASECR